MAIEKKTGMKGFTVIELLIALTILGLVLSITISAVNWKNRHASDLATKLNADFTSIEMAFSLYSNNTNTYPAGLTDSSFVPQYLFSPRAPEDFNRPTGTGWSNGYYLGQQTGQTSPNNGYFICTSVSVTDKNDAKFIALTNVAKQAPASKFFYNTTTCTTNGSAAISNMADPTTSATIYAVYWLTRD